LSAIHQALQRDYGIVGQSRRTADQSGTRLIGCLKVLLRVSIEVINQSTVVENLLNLTGYRRLPSCVQPAMDDIEREAIRDDPDDPAVVAAIDRVRAELKRVGVEPLIGYSALVTPMPTRLIGTPHRTQTISAAPTPWISMKVFGFVTVQSTVSRSGELPFAS
jgi:hypothetical protein